MEEILVVDDDIHIGNILESTLSREGYKVERAYSGTEAKLLLNTIQPDLILLDLMLPGLSGEELLQQIKDIPVIVVSAKVDVDSKVGLLLGGAVDYVTKPFELKELLARIKVRLQKKGKINTDETFEYNEINLNTLSQSVTVSGILVKLTRTEYAILKLLIQNPKQVITKSVFLDKISLDTPDCTERSLKQHISNLRKKLEDISGKEYIETVWGIGFKMAE